MSFGELWVSVENSLEFEVCKQLQPFFVIIFAFWVAHLVFMVVPKSRTN